MALYGNNYPRVMRDPAKETLRRRPCDVVAILRSAAGRNPYDRELTDLVGELLTRSEEFRQHWAKHDVRFHISGVKRYRHRDAGDLELNYARLEVVFDTRLTIFRATRKQRSNGGRSRQAQPSARTRSSRTCGGGPARPLRSPQRRRVRAWTSGLSG